MLVGYARAKEGFDYGNVALLSPKSCPRERPVEQRLYISAKKPIVFKIATGIATLDIASVNETSTVAPGGLKKAKLKNMELESPKKNKSTAVSITKNLRAGLTRGNAKSSKRNIAKINKMKVVI